MNRHFACIQHWVGIKVFGDFWFVVPVGLIILNGKSTFSIFGKGILSDFMPQAIYKFQYPQIAIFCGLLYGVMETHNGDAQLCVFTLRFVIQNPLFPLQFAQLCQVLRYFQCFQIVATIIVHSKNSGWESIPVQLTAKAGSLFACSTAGIEAVLPQFLPPFPLR